ncbi:putative protein ASPARTIC PROTEASE IN GUARD CELL 1-like [Capsicum annuum]|nr:putative protein ASPARTIC PROTEASE IN GUARD CELL 1-like [Capsicum annuum]
MGGVQSFGPEYSGIAGIGRRELSGGYSLPSQFGADIMAMCLSGIDSQRSTLSFHTTPFEKTLSAELLPDPSNPEFYYVDLYKVFINDKEITLNPSIWNFRNAIDYSCLVDTGTAATYFPRDFYNVFRDTFRQEVQNIRLVNGPRPGGFDTCYRVYLGVVPNFPVVKMYFGHQDPNNLLLLTHQRVMAHVRGMFCLAFYAWDEDYAILGVNQLQVYLYFRNPGHASATKDMRVLTKSHEPRSVVSEPSPTAPYDVDLSDDMFDEDDMLDMF